MPIYTATAADIINDAAVELGLITTDIVDPYGSTNQNVIHLCRLFKKVGRGLAREFGWTQLRSEHTFNTVAATASYELCPSDDFLSFVEGTAWNRTTDQPLVGPLTSKQWQALLGSSSTSIRQGFRVWQGLLYLTPTPTATEAIYYEYQSDLWLSATGTPSVRSKNGSVIHTDIPWFDTLLLVADLKLAFLKAKGFDTTAVQDERDAAFARASGADDAPKVLNITGGGFRPDRMIDALNVPDTGFGD